MNTTNRMLPPRLISMLMLVLVLALGLSACAGPVTAPQERPAADPLPSWNAGPTRTRILDFVAEATDPDSTAFVPVAERIAVFDNDGTLWAEQPAYFQLLFAMDWVRSMAPANPEWASTEPYRSVLENDMGALAAQGEAALVTLVLASHTGMSETEFRIAVEDWLATARHPTTGRPYTEMVYQPMLELLDYLREHDFQTWIVSGGGISFMRPFTESVYGIPPEQVVGSSVVTRFENGEEGPVIMREPEFDFIDDKAGKPVGIQRHIGRRPVIAFGNSDGDLQMLQWAVAQERPSLAGYIHHTDAEREWAYDRTSNIGRLDQGLDEAQERGWLIVDMARDWSVVFPPLEQP